MVSEFEAKVKNTKIFSLRGQLQNAQNVKIFSLRVAVALAPGAGVAGGRGRARARHARVTRAAPERVWGA